MKTLQEIASFIGGTILVGEPSLKIESLAGLEDAGKGDLSFYGDAKYKKAADATQADALLVSEKLASFQGAQIATPMPYLAFMQLVADFYPAHKPAAGAHPTAFVAQGAKVAASASIGPHAVIDEGASIGERTVVSAGAYVGRGAIVGDDVLLHPNVSVLHRVVLGARVIVHAGTVIGSDGFGYRRDEHGHQKIPHVGNVIVGDDVEIGANCAIDRGTFGRTQIGNGTKIDNLVHLAHNVRIGERTLVIAQVGMAGSVRVGNDAIVAGQAGIADHAVVEDAAIIGPQTAVPTRAKSGEIYYGTPAMPRRTFMEVHASLKFLPKLLKRVRFLEKKVGVTQTADDA